MYVLFRLTANRKPNLNFRRNDFDKNPNTIQSNIALSYIKLRLRTEC